MRLTHIDAFRGLTALLVVFFHLLYSSGISNVAGPVLLYTYLKVEVFFVITGFVLLYSLHKKNYQVAYFPGFVLKRLLRLDPAYFASMAGSLFLAYITHNSLPSVTQFFLHFGYLNDLFGYKWINPVFWTLAIEFQFYLFLGLAYKAFTAPGHRIFTMVILSLLAGTLMAFYLFPSLTFLPRYFGFFVMGILVFRLRALQMPVYLFVVLSALTLGVIMIANGPAYAFTALLTALAILFIKMGKTGIVNKSLHWLGTISYSIYLIHWPLGVSAVTVLRHVPFLAASPLLRILAGLVITVIGAWVFYLLIEKPSIRWSNSIRLKKARHLQPDPPVAATPIFSPAVVREKLIIENDTFTTNSNS